MSTTNETPRWIYSTPGNTLWQWLFIDQGLLFYSPDLWNGFPPMTDDEWTTLNESKP